MSDSKHLPRGSAWLGICGSLAAVCTFASCQQKKAAEQDPGSSVKYALRREHATDLTSLPLQRLSRSQGQYASMLKIYANLSGDGKIPLLVCAMDGPVAAATLTTIGVTAAKALGDWLRLIQGFSKGNVEVVPLYPPGAVCDSVNGKGADTVHTFMKAFVPKVRVYSDSACYTKSTGVAQEWLSPSEPFFSLDVPPSWTQDIVQAVEPAAKQAVSEDLLAASYYGWGWILGVGPAAHLRNEETGEGPTAMDAAQTRLQADDEAAINAAWRYSKEGAVSVGKLFDCGANYVQKHTQVLETSRSYITCIKNQSQAAEAQEQVKAGQSNDIFIENGLVF